MGDKAEKSTDPIITEIEEASKSPDIPKYYANAFLNAMGIGDISILCKNNNQPILLLNVSYTVAKTLVEKLNELIQALEDKTGNEIMTTDFILDKLVKKEEK